jgi:arginine/lysine/ornithine decarboxylase
VSINNGNKVKSIQNSDDINIIDLSEETIDFIIFGSAGLYEKYKYDECFTSVWKYINKKNFFKYENIHSFSGGIVDHLIKTAMKKGSYENISCLFLGFEEFLKKYEEIKNNSVQYQAWECEKAIKTEAYLCEAEGLICGDFVYAYPPGIPLLVPGEIISKDIVDDIFNRYNSGVEIVGLKDGKLIKVIQEK